ncbi:IS21 family transposase [Candidatus Chlorohelix allophototropha]
MLKLEERMDVQLLKKQGLSIRAIAEQTSYSRNTVRKILRQQSGATHEISRKIRSSKLDPFKPYLENRFKQYPLSAVRLMEEIKPMGYTGSIDVLRRFLQSLKPRRQALAKATIRFETPPGEQAQADWAYCDRFLDPNGETIPIYAFVIVLGFSRMLYLEFTTSMELPILLECHKHAFEYFEGSPATILYDNMKQIKLAPGQFNPLYLDFAQYYGLVPKTHRVRRPRTKGKIERMVDYVKDNFLTGRTFIDLVDLNSQGRIWLEQTANVRVHATTGHRPVDLWQLEKAKLGAYQTLPPYQITSRELRKVSAESFVHWAGSRYSVPPEHVGQTVLVEVRQGQQRIVIRSNNLIIAEHIQAAKPGLCIAEKAHLEALWKLSLGNPPAPAHRWQVTFNETVLAPALSSYEEVI